MKGRYRPAGPRSEDRADFEAVLRLALDTPDIRDALRADASGLAERRLRFRAEADADAIMAVAHAEHEAYLAALASAAGASATGGEWGAPAVDAPGGKGDAPMVEDAEGRAWRRAADAELLPLVAVLTPSLAASSAAVVLVLGYLLRLTGVRGTLPGSLIAAGWTLTLFAAVSALLAFAALFRTALRGHGDRERPGGPEQARLVWRQALLYRGMLPHLRRCLHEDPSLSGPSPRNRPA
ncbi:hypothetical protein [Streptomyces griseiscabiei]|uniref:Transmembrane protein n=1 Tax=Streptomyces griseiscabiei TaxID=2993540 RepID=A0ABU4L574_9ACTN|nr:hypothetical protein [Streptomyces griseiscabiei]MBZ3901861.1 hypothetical protein [Streptomyces griseiscabiei]MDX2910939.1 hypothetical protein [Streptomyces griseiscabiei]